MIKNVTALIILVIIGVIACADSNETPIKITENKVDVAQMDRAAEFTSRLFLGWNEGRFAPLPVSSVTPRIIEEFTQEKQASLFEGGLLPLCGKFIRLIYTETQARGDERIYCFRGVFENAEIQPEIIIAINKGNLVSDIVIRIPPK